MAPQETVFVSTSPGLEPALLDEARRLGEATSVPGGVELRGAEGLHQEACLRLRVANQVLLRLAEVHLRGADVQKALRSVGVDALGPVVVEASARGTVSARQLLAAAGEVWPVAKAGTRMLLRLEGERLSVSADCAGELLFRRGYRQEISRAPLRETLAAGMLALGGYDGELPLLDPMCGSGTLVIEAAWLARRRAPGLLRTFSFEQWRGFDAAAFQARKARAVGEERALTVALKGTDLNAGSLGVARRNARRAGVAEIVWERQDALTARAEGSPGFVVANLPYGKRVGGEGDPVALHRRFGEALRARFAGWTALLLTAEELADALGLEPEAAWAIDNGGIRCRLLKVKLRAA